MGTKIALGLTVCLLAWMPAQGRSPTPALDGVFTIFHHTQPQQVASPSQLIWPTLKEIKKAPTSEDAIVSIVNTLIKNPIDSQQSLSQIKSLVEARRIARRVDHYTRGKDRRILLTGMQAIIEELMWLHYQRYKNEPGFDPVLRFNFIPAREIARFCPQDHFPFRNAYTLCKGDILLTRGSAMSSTFLARMTQVPGNFSHTTVATTYQGQAVTVEALIEDGVKLRPMDTPNGYNNYQLRKLAVLRKDKGLPLFREPFQRSLNDNIDQFIEKMVTRLAASGVSAEDVPQALINQTSIPYDFAMNSASGEKMFCSEVVQQIYNWPDLADKNRPFTQELISAPAAGSQILLSDFMGIKESRLPAPSDQDLNSRYEYVLLEYDTSQLGLGRLQDVLIDLIIQLTQENQEQLKPLFLGIAQLGQTPIENPQALAEILPPQYHSMLGKVPAGININQIIFFEFLNTYLDKRARAELSELIPASTSYGQLQERVRDWLLSAATEYTAVIKRAIDQNVLIRGRLSGEDVGDDQNSPSSR